MYLIDATAFCYRAFYALRGLSTSFGQPTNAIYGFLAMLDKILKDNKPDYMAVCFDVSRDTFRQRKFSDYKIQRPPMPDGLAGQIPFIKEIVASYGIALFQKEGFEADDIIATVNRKAKEKGMHTVIISSDKDILQLVDKDTAVFSPSKDGGVTYDEKAVLERFGVPPERITDIIALMGDDVDNIPGVTGIGEKTAVALIKEFGSLDNLLKHCEKIGKERLKLAIENEREKIKLNKELAVLDTNAELDFDLERVKIGSPDTKELLRLFKHLEFKSFLKNLPLQQQEEAEVSIQEIPDEALRDVMAMDTELVLYGAEAQGMVFFSNRTFFRLKNFGGNIKNALSDSKVKKISHDLKKIKVSLARQGIVLSGMYFDTMIAAHLLNPSRAAYALSDLSWEYLEKTPLSPEGESRQAAHLIVELRKRLEEELKAKSLLRLFQELEMPLAEVLAEMEIEGITIDKEFLQSLSLDLEKRLLRLIDAIYGISQVQFNLNSPKQLREILFERLGLPVIKRSKTGPSTDEEVLRALATRHELPKLLLEYRQLSKLKNTYVDALPALIDAETGRIHTSFNQVATETGRLSSSHPNLQNIPIKTDIGRRIRQAIISSSPDRLLLACDYSQIELRILAHLSKDENLISAFKEDRDIHKAAACLIYGINEAEITEQMRDVAKRVNFGILYGQSAYGLARDLEIPLQEAQAFIDAYFLRYPRVKGYIEECINAAQQQGFVTTMLGRRRYLPEINNKNQAIRQLAERQAINTPIQGSASDLIKLAMIAISHEVRRSNLKSRMLLQVHDELVFDAPRSELEQLSVMVKERMENVLTLDVPIKVEVKKGMNWLELEPS